MILGTGTAGGYVIHKRRCIAARRQERPEIKPDSARFYHPARDHSGRAMNDALKPFLIFVASS
jgi:hypothetical protein